MRKILFTISLIVILIEFSFQAFGVGAYPKAVVIRQPDGTKVDVQFYGDEFLHWATSGNRLVEIASDGYVYYAYYDKEGYLRRTNSRVATGKVVMMTNAFSSITPPAIAIQRALLKREQLSKFVKKVSTNSMQKTSSTIDKAALSSGERRYLVILAEFSDLSFTVDGANAAFSNMLNQPGYSENGGTGSAKDYFEDNSRGAFRPIFDVKGPINVGKNYSYYGANFDDGNDAHPDQLIADVCKKLNETDPSVNFADYDNDGDGIVDNVFVYYAGHNEAEGGGAETIWPHRWSLWNIQESDRSFDGVKVYDYACTSEYRLSTGTEMCGIGTFCHEFGHILGLPDFYDTDYETNGIGKGLSSFSLMSSGNYNNDGKTPPYLNAEERMLLEWMEEPTEISSASEISARSINNNVAYKINTSNNGEYFLFEARNQNGWDSYIPSGLLIYHIDKSQNDVGGQTASYRWTSQSKINAYSAHQCMDLVETLPESELVYLNDYIFPGRPPYLHTSFTPETTPAFKGWNGNSTGFSITNISITEDGASFSVTYSGDNSIRGRIINSSNQPVASKGVQVNVYSDETSFITYNKVSDTDGYFTLSPVEVSKKFVVSVEEGDGYVAYNSGDLYTVTGVSTLTVRLFKPNENILLSRGFSVIDTPNTEFSNGQPFYFNVLYGKENAISTNWTYDGAPKNDGSYVNLTSGSHTVIATIVYPNGTIETIEKTIVVP